MPMQIPPAPEQQKIADCLGSLDDLIAAEGRKLEALRQHKQGLMQQLFPQPGETEPLLGGQSDWKTLDLSKVAFFQEGPGIMADRFSLGRSTVGEAVWPRRKNRYARWMQFPRSLIK